LAGFRYKELENLYFKHADAKNTACLIVLIIYFLMF
jgi:hypothetical protein